MLDLTAYLDDLVAALRARFGARLLYVGLQGSRLRGEARKDSDIDVMLVLEGLTYEDLTAYRALLQALGQFDLACGFVCGREDLLRWNPLELYHLLHTTRDVYGALAPLLPPHTRADAARYVQLGSNNLFHELCHRTVHGAAPCAPEALAGMCKAAFFLLQDLRALETGEFAQNRAVLRPLLSDLDAQVLALDEALRRGESVDAEVALRLLLRFSRDAARRALLV